MTLRWFLWLCLFFTRLVCSFRYQRLKLNFFLSHFCIGKGTTPTSQKHSAQTPHDLSSIFVKYSPYRATTYARTIRAALSSGIRLIMRTIKVTLVDVAWTDVDWSGYISSDQAPDTFLRSPPLPGSTNRQMVGRWWVIFLQTKKGLTRNELTP